MSIDLNAIKAKLNQLNKTDDRKNNLWKPQPGKQTIRIVPYSHRKENPFLVLLFCIIIYFFMETLVSFTLWMHKGFYLSLGIYSAYVYFLKTKRQLQLQNEI